MGFEMSTIPDSEMRDEHEEGAVAPRPLFVQLRAFQELMERQRQVVVQVEQALDRAGWRRYLLGRDSPLRRATRAAHELERVHAATLEAAATLARTAVRESGETPAELPASADEYDGMRRQFEDPSPEQVKRVSEFLSQTPAPPQA